ncbi:ABC transporter ATP-binding protein [Shinella sp. CPCC 101442]|uniref:ABC transporter ATP-binding protein n=1 Tax=Shinella sp. CPCC 101442 TaxID=2932265 RepID=UPI0021538B5D|nr:ABC transporter ATP-binding protein [Shinella sp. CPCC 101442]MCR6500430.1 ABC transporter ATP-binding protein [Shinella sp. CPCC 101442]
MSIRNLDVRLGRLDVIRDVNLDVEEGRITVIVGANGAGKSTLLRTVAGLNKVARGSILFKGKEIANLPAHRIAAMGISMVPEGRHLFREMTVAENLEMGGYLCRGKPGAMAANMERVFDLFPVLKEHRHRKAKTFSGGQQQMITIGRGLMSDPQLLIVDELSLGLAPKVISEILEKIVLLNRQGMSIYLVEQNVKQALKIAHQGYVLDNGSITIRGSAENLLADPEVQRTYLGL